MANLAIKGHLNRGKEVIKILEMLGGTNRDNCWGIFDTSLYLINALGDIEERSLSDDFNYQTYTLEKFLEKFPYKVGDKVQHKGATSCGTVYEIEQIKWEDNQVKYIICDLYWKNCKCTVTSEDLQPYKEETMEVSEEFFNKYCANCGSQRCTAEGEWLEGCKHYKEETMEETIKIDIPKGYKFAGIDDDNQQVVFERIGCQYPKTYEECCNILDWNHRDYDRVGYNSELLCKLQVLLLCRDAYWKIAGDWKPNLGEDFIYAIGTCYGAVEKRMVTGGSGILLFPTEEMRDSFYENFKDLIEQCKELL